MGDLPTCMQIPEDSTAWRDKVKWKAPPQKNPTHWIDGIKTGTLGMTITQHLGLPKIGTTGEPL